MESFLNHLFRGALERLGIDEGQQFFGMIAVLLVCFMVYAVRYRTDRLLRALWLVVAVSCLVFLFSGSVRVRWTAACAVGGSIAAAFGWAAVRSRMAASSARKGS